MREVFLTLFVKGLTPKLQTALHQCGRELGRCMGAMIEVLGAPHGLHISVLVYPVKSRVIEGVVCSVSLTAADEEN